MSGTLGEALGIAIPTALELLRQYATAHGRDPDEACAWACQQYPGLREAVADMEAARQRALDRVSGR